MTTTLTVIPARVWRNAVNGRTASIYGACPWWNEAERNEWAMQDAGWTWERVSPRGSVTVGLSRPPAATAAEAYITALEIAERVPVEVRLGPEARKAIDPQELALAGYEVADLFEA